MRGADDDFLDAQIAAALDDLLKRRIAIGTARPKRWCRYI